MKTVGILGEKFTHEYLVASFINGYNKDLSHRCPKTWQIKLISECKEEPLTGRIRIDYIWGKNKEETELLSSICNIRYTYKKNYL